MKNKNFIFTLCCLVLFSLMFFSCSKENSSSTSTTDQTEGKNWWDKFGTPQYGGTISIRTASLDNVSFDPGVMLGPDAWQFWLEQLFFFDWTLDRNVWAYPSGFVPIQYVKGLLAESWEQKDPLTVIIKLKKGIKFQDKAPVNGREFVASDVEYSFDRMLGTGSGFTAPNAFAGMNLSNIKKAKALDKYTVEVKYKAASAMAIYQLVGGMGSVSIVPHEWGKIVPNPPTSAPGGPGGPGGPPPPPPGGGGKGGPGGPPPGGPGGPPGGPAGPSAKWQDVAGTGAWILKEFIQGSTLTFVKNPNYWGFDERFPENKLPYADEHKVVAIPDISTAMAALRTGKIDMIADMRGGLTWQQAKSLQKSNPDIQISWLPGPGSDLDMRIDKKPFTDIRVRKALQMAIDRKTIAKTYLGGTVDGTPCGLAAPSLKGWTLPYSEWPEKLQKEYSYNPAEAKKLLAEAGYPKGFKTNCIAAGQDDIQMLQAVKSYLMEIGVDVSIKTMDPGSFMDFVMSGKHDQMVLNNATGLSFDPGSIISHYSKTDMRNYTKNNDPKYEEIVSQFNKATDTEKAIKLFQQADRYANEQHWAVNVVPVSTPIATQSYLKGYSGELQMGAWPGYYRARFWIDQDMKKKMGR